MAEAQIGFNNIIGKNGALVNKYTVSRGEKKFLSLTTFFSSKMLPPGVIVVFVLVGLAAIAIIAIQVQKKLKAKKSNQRF